MGFEGALEIVCQHFDSPLAEEFSRTLQEMELGLPRRDAFQNLKRRTEVPELSNFVLALLQADALGIPIGRVLETQATEMRNKRRQWAREKAAKLPVKMLFPLVAVHLPGHPGRDPRPGGGRDLARPSSSAMQAAPSVARGLAGAAGASAHVARHRRPWATLALGLCWPPPPGTITARSAPGRWLWPAWPSGSRTSAARRSGHGSGVRADPAGSSPLAVDVAAVVSTGYWGSPFVFCLLAAS